MFWGPPNDIVNSLCIREAQEHLKEPISFLNWLKQPQKTANHYFLVEEKRSMV